MRLFNERGRKYFALSFREMEIKKKGGGRGEIGVGFSDLHLSYINEDSILRYELHVHSILFEWRPVFKNMNTIIHLQPLEFLKNWDASS